MESSHAKSVAYFELAVSLYLWRWPALTLAVQNEWGGPDSAEKRDWLAGVLADMFTTKPVKSSNTAAAAAVVEVEDVEDVAAQVMMDEFQTVLEDDSAYDLAKTLCDTWKDCQDGHFDKIEALKKHFENSKSQQQQKAQRQRAEDDSDESSGTDAELDEDAPALTSDAMDVDPPSKPEPIVDEDGFELVQAKGKKGRK